MSAAELPTDDRREPLLGDAAFDPSRIDEDRPTDPDALAPRETLMSLDDPDQPLGTDPPPAGREPPVLDFADDQHAERPRARNRPGFVLLAAGLLVGVLLLTALAFLFQSSEPDVEPAASLTEPLEATPAPPATPAPSAPVEALRAELRDLRAQVSQIQQAPDPAPELREQLASIERRLREAADVELLIARLDARLDEQAARITFLDDVLSQMRRQESTQARGAPPPPPVELPFRLVAIDSWEGRLYASLLHEGRSILAQPGETCAGWTVESIDGARREVLFVRDGRRAVRRAPN